MHQHPPSQDPQQKSDPIKRWNTNISHSHALLQKITQRPTRGTPPPANEHLAPPSGRFSWQKNFARLHRSDSRRSGTVAPIEPGNVRVKRNTLRRGALWDIFEGER